MGFRRGRMRVWILEVRICIGVGMDEVFKYKKEGVREGRERK